MLFILVLVNLLFTHVCNKRFPSSSFFPTYSLSSFSIYFPILFHFALFTSLTSSSSVRSFLVPILHGDSLWPYYMWSLCLHCYRRQSPARILMKTTLKKVFSSKFSFEKNVKSENFTLQFISEQWCFTDVFNSIQGKGWTSGKILISWSVCLFFLHSQ